jgi:hypothetical protein
MQGIVFRTNINAQDWQLLLVGFRRESGGKKGNSRSPLSPTQIYLWNISTNNYAGVNYSTNPVVNLAEVLYFRIFFKKLYLLYIGTERVLLNKSVR